MPQRSDDSIAMFRAATARAAAQLFARGGHAAVTMREIASLLNCSPMLPYRYFRDRDEILALLRAEAYDRFAAHLEQAFAQGGDTPYDRARAIGTAFFDFALTHPDDYRLMFDLRQPDSDRYPELAAARARSRATAVLHMNELVAAGILAGDPEQLGLAFFAAAHGIVVLALDGYFDPSQDARALYRMTMRMLFRGARARPVAK
jgi:AcrR family transcriptional regulator